MIYVAVLLAVAACALFVRLKVKFMRDAAQCLCEVRYGPLVLYDTSRPGPKSTTQKHHRERRRRSAVQPLIEMAPQLFAAFARGLSYGAKRIRLDRFRLAGTIQAEDPAMTAMLYAAFPALSAILGTYISEMQVSVSPEFLDREARLLVDAQASVRAGTIIAFLVVVLVHLPIRELARYTVHYVRR